MREIDELYADSGEPVEESHGFSRGTALKVGGLGLAGAFAAFLPGRALASTKRRSAKASNASCSGTGFVCAGSNKAKACGYDNYSYGACFCGSLYYGKIRPAGAPVGACVENVECDDQAVSCTKQRDCGPGFVCIYNGCCFDTPVCMHFCEQGSQGQAAPKLNKKGTYTHR
jgi:hypothetical protein